MSDFPHTGVRPEAARSLPAKGTPAPASKGLALAVIAVAQLMVVLDVSIVNVALPSMQKSLGFSTTNLEWVVNAYALAFGGLLLLGGRIADVYGQRRTLVAGIALITVASLVGGLAQDQGWLLAARTAQGVAGALVAPAALALLAGTFAEGPERHRAMGVYAAMSGAGGALGNVLGGVFTDELSWRWVLFVNVPIGLFVLAAAPRAFRESNPMRGRLDLPGALSATLGMTSLVYGLDHAGSHSWGSTGTVLPIVLGVVLLVVFVAVEARGRHALMPLRIFRNRNRSSAYAIMLLLGAGLLALFYFLTLFMQIVLAYSPMRTGFSFLAFAVGAAAASGAAGALLGRVGARPLLAFGTLAGAASLFWLSRLSADGSYWSGLMGPLVIFGIGAGFCFVPLTIAAVDGVAAQESGVSSALLNAGQQVGYALGLGVLGTVAATATRHKARDLAASFAGHGSPSAASVKQAAGTALTHGYAQAFMVGGFLLLGACAIALVGVRVSADADALKDLPPAM